MRWLRNGHEHEYDATDEDALVLAQAIAREGAPHDAVAWTLVQRFALLHPKYPTLAAFVRAYSQPINPRWFPDGDKHLARLEQLDAAAQRDEKRRAANRLKYAEVEWSELPAYARQLALTAIEAEGDSPVPGAVHFRASMAKAGEDKRRAHRRAKMYADGRSDLVDVVRLREGYGRGVNWFFTSRGNVQMLADGEDALVPPGPDPKDGGPQTGPSFPPAPDGLPSGPGWGWAWSWSPRSSSPSGTAEADTPAASERYDETPEPSAGDDGQDADQREEGPELPPGDVISIDDARVPGFMGDDGPAHAEHEDAETA